MSELWCTDEEPSRSFAICNATCIEDIMMAVPLEIGSRDLIVSIELEIGSGGVTGMLNEDSPYCRSYIVGPADHMRYDERS